MSEAAFQRPQRPPPLRHADPRQVIGNPGISDRIRSEQVIGFDRNPHVRKLERERPGRTVEELSGAVFTELAIKRTQRAADLVAEAIRLARPRQPGTEITGSQWQASTSEVRNWALSAGFELGADGTIPGPAITAYNQIHPGRPY